MATFLHRAPSKWLRSLQLGIIKVQSFILINSLLRLPLHISSPTRWVPFQELKGRNFMLCILSMLTMPLLHAILYLKQSPLKRFFCVRISLLIFSHTSIVGAVISQLHCWNQVLKEKKKNKKIVQKHYPVALQPSPVLLVPKLYNVHRLHSMSGAVHFGMAVHRQSLFHIPPVSCGFRKLDSILCVQSSKNKEKY